MTRGLWSLAAVLALVGCPSSETEVTSAGSSSESGSDPSSSSGGPTTSATSMSATEATMSSTSVTDPTGDTTCNDGCTTDTDGTTDATTTGPGDTSSSGEGSESSTDAESSSSEGPGAVCGDGQVDGDEDCDDLGESAACDDDCTFADCGDAHLNVSAGEICDAGGESLNCDVDCTLPVCGDGIANASDNELCDDGGPSPQCDTDCTFPACGDGSQNIAAFETCDDGNDESGDGCSASCLIEGDLGGLCAVVGGTQWCFDDDNCGAACEDVCQSLGLTIEPSDAAWFAAQDTPAECQAISDAFGMTDPITFGPSALGCLEDGAAGDAVGSGLTGSLSCSSDPNCPGAHRTDMNDLGSICGLPGARRSVCPCAGEFCGNGVVEGSEICDDGNHVNNDGCNSSCNTGPNVCDGGTDPGTGAPYVVCSVDGDSAWVSIADGNGGQYHPVVICQELGYDTVGEWGGTCGNVCGYCEGETSCDNNGTPQFDNGAWNGFGNCGEDALGQILCQTVQWTCV